MLSLISIYIGGSLTLLMALFHIRFPKLFKWKAEYIRISEMNQKIFYTIHLALLLMVLLIGMATLLYAKELSESTGVALGFNVLCCVFWLWRTLWQVIYFKGKILHFTLIVIFLIVFISYLIPVITELGK